jgi:hypothetical protein
MTTYRTWGLWVCLGFSGLVAGCGGDSDDDGGGDGSGERCEFEACGGDIVGTWEVDSACVTIDELPAPSDDPECQDFVRDYSAEVSGTITFTADGTTATSLTNTISLDVAVTSACWEAMSGTELTSAYCDALEAQLLAGGEFSAAACSFTSGTCLCSLVVPPTTTNETGTYTVDGNELIDQDGEAAGYCVNDDQLTMKIDNDEGTIVFSATLVP